MKNTKLFNSNFTIIILGQLISMLGNSIQRFAFSLYILELTGSAAMFSTILSIEIIPIIILSPLGGAIADRLSKKRIMAGLDFCCYIIIGIFTFFVYGGNYQVIFVALLMFLLSLINSVYQPAVEASIPEVVKEEQFNAANSIVTQINSFTTLIGPIIAGFLYGIIGIKYILIINMTSYLFSALMELFLKMPYKKRDDNKVSLSVYLADIKEGYKYLYKEEKTISDMILIISGLNLFITPLFYVGVPYVEKIIFGVSDKLYGFSEGFLGLGMITGAIFINIIAEYITFNKSYIYFIGLSLSAALMGISTFSFVINMDSYHIIAFCIFSIAGFIMTNLISCINIQFMTNVQINIPQDMMGKTIGLITGLSTALIPIGQVVFGVLFDKLNFMLFPLYLVSAIIALVCAKYIYKILLNEDVKNMKKNKTA